MQTTISKNYDGLTIILELDYAYLTQHLDPLGYNATDLNASMLRYCQMLYAELAQRYPGAVLDISVLCDHMLGTGNNLDTAWWTWTPEKAEDTPGDVYHYVKGAADSLLKQGYWFTAAEAGQPCLHQAGVCDICSQP